MDSCARDELQRPFPRDANQPQDNVEDLKDGNGFDCGVEVLGEEVPEYFGPKEPVYSSANLV